MPKLLHSIQILNLATFQHAVGTRKYIILCHCANFCGIVPPLIDQMQVKQTYKNQTSKHVLNNLQIFLGIPNGSLFSSSKITIKLLKNLKIMSISCEHEGGSEICRAGFSFNKGKKC